MPVPQSSLPHTRTSLRAVAEEQIRRAIFDGTLQPGEALNDADLQKWLGVSRTPIREALNDLARLGLVEMAPQRYTRVATPRPEERTFVLQTLGALVGGVIRVTASAMSAEQKSSILSALDEVIAAVRARDTHEHGRLVWLMLHQFIEYCPNPILVQATRDTIDSLAFQLSATRTEQSTNWEGLNVGYPDLRTAIVGDDPIAAELAIQRVFRL